MEENTQLQRYPSTPGESSAVEFFTTNGRAPIVNNFFVQEQNITTRIEGSHIDTVGGPSRMSSINERPEVNQEMIGDENTGDCTRLSPKVVMFNKLRASHQSNSHVYRGRQEIVAGRYRDVAIKLIQYSEQNLTEIENLLTLKQHMHIVQIYEAGEYRSLGHWIYIVMEFCSMNLEEYINVNQPEPATAILFFKQIISAVEYMHVNNIAHRDIKPTNILISERGDAIKFSDFGISKEIPHGVTSVTVTSYGVGSEGYKPPEVYKPDYKVTLKSDIFSLGLVTTYLFTHGKHPFGDDPLDWSYKIRKNMEFDLSQIPQDTRNREQLVSMIARMLCHHPDERPTINQIKRESVFLEKFDNHVDNVATNADGTDIMNDDAVPPEDSETDETCIQELNDMHIYKKPAIVLFDFKSRYLYGFDHRNESITKMHKYPWDFSLKGFSAVSLGEYIYVLGRTRSVHRLKYCDVRAKWDKMSDWTGDHQGFHPPLVASLNAIFLVGCGEMTPQKASKLVSKYDPSLDLWKRITKKPTATSESALLCSNDFLYCIGGSDVSGQPTNNVEIMDLTTKTWLTASNMLWSRRNVAAAECEGKIYVVGGTDNIPSMEMYDPNRNQWTERKSFVISGNTANCRRLLGIDGTLFAITAELMATYDINENKWSVVKLKAGKLFDEAVLISLFREPNVLI